MGAETKLVLKNAGPPAKGFKAAVGNLLTWAVVALVGLFVIVLITVADRSNPDQPRCSGETGTALADLGSHC